MRGQRTGAPVKRSSLPARLPVQRAGGCSGQHSRVRRARRQLNSCRLQLRVRACKLECRVGDCRLHLNLSLAPPPLHPLLAPPAGTLRFVRGPAFGVTPSPPHVTCSPRLLGGGIQGGEWVRAIRFLALRALPRAGPPSDSCRRHWQWALQGRALRAENPASNAAIGVCDAAIGA
jgi:hypothetical protein